MCVLAFSFVSVYAINADLQVYYDFGSQGTACANQRSHRVTTTVELLHPDAWGMTFFFFDMDYSINRSNDNPQDPKNMPFGTYWEISRGFNFWQNSKAKDLSVHLEYNGGLGVFGGKVVAGGYGINHAVLVGLDYFLHTPDYKNTFMLELLFKYIADEYNMWQFKKEGQWGIFGGRNKVFWTARPIRTLTRPSSHLYSFRSRNYGIVSVNGSIVRTYA